MEVLSLGEFLQNNYGIAYPENDLLRTIFITQNHQKALEIDDKELPFNDLINSCRCQLLAAGYKDNVLVHGYQLTNKGAIPKENFSYNANNTFLNSQKWRSLHLVIGTYAMKDILINHSGFQLLGKGFNHLFGDSLEVFKYTKNFTRSTQFSLGKVLYKDNQFVRKLNPIPFTKREFLQKVFSEEYSNLKDPTKVPKKMYGFSKLCTKIIKKHKECRYFQIVNQICVEPISDDNLALALDKKQIIRFVTVCFDKVFEEDVYGSKRNKAVIFHNFSKLILGEKGFFLTLIDCLDGLKLKDIKWLGQSNLCKQEYEKRHKLLTSFITWLFSCYLPNLLASFFHITHVSSSRELLYYHHTTWRKITQSFLKEYKDTYLTLREQTTITQTEKAKPLYCVFRLMPKKNNDFRVINVPIKGSLNVEVKEYQDRVNKEIRPTKRILNHLRLTAPSTFTKISSVNQIPLKLFEFKKSLLTKYGKLPPLFFLKFDLRACYDNIPKDLVRTVLNDIITPESVYFHYTQNEIDLKSQSKSQSKKVLTIDEIGTVKPSRRPILWNEGRKRVSSMVGREIFDLTKSQLDHSFTKIGDRYFSREKGIFQGLHLSSLFCDIVLDKLMDENFPGLEDTETTFLRIADDFMLISTDSKAIKQTEKTITTIFGHHGITINKLKTFMNFDSSQEKASKDQEVVFCGMTINTNDLSVYKEFDSSIYSLSVRSHSQAIKRLINIFKMRLSYNNLNTPMNSLVYRLKHIDSLAANLAESYFKCLKHLKITLHGFKWFINELILTLRPLVHKEDLHYHQISIYSNFIDVLKRNNTKYKECIEYSLHKCEKLKESTQITQDI